MRVLWLIWISTATLLPAPAMKCGALASRPFGHDVTIHSATLVAAKGSVPEHCDIRGVIWPEAGFAMKLPTAWNERFQMVGNSGTAGTISLGALDNALRKGFAAASTDTGHSEAKEPAATFAYVTPENPHGKRKLTDFAYLSVHETAVLAKQVMRAFYGAAPRYSYWVGCSTGGRQGMQEAQRYPEDFDGLVIGAPGLNLTDNTMRRIWAAQTQLGSGEISPGQLPALARAVYDKCDAVDGLKDGIIDDPRGCDFVPARDVPACPGGGSSCFTAAQIEALAKIYAGPRDSRGRQLFPGEPVGSELVWAEKLIGPMTGVFARTESQIKLAMLHPPPGPSWNYTMFNFDTDPPRMAQAAAELNPLNPNLAPLQKRGGKILQYSGWADPQVNPLAGIDYYEKVTKRLGTAATRGFYRLYMVPGMYHCSAGPGCNTVDWLTAVMAWVEEGIAPEALTGAHIENGRTTRTRPLCPYPQVARYKGAGSIDQAVNFACAARMVR